METFVVAKCLVVNAEGKILTLRRSKTDTRRPHQIDIPGGMVEPFEDAWTAVQRETLEETSVEIDHPRLVFGMSDIAEERNGTWLVFVAHVKGTPPVKTSSEHDAYNWLDIQTALNQMVYERQRRMLEHVIKYDLLHAK